jgi:periplasmic protein TonB
MLTMTVWEEYQGNVTVRGRWLPPLMLSLALHLCLLRLLVPAREVQTPRILGRDAMAVILTSPAQPLSTPAARWPEPQPRPAPVLPVAVASPAEPVRRQEKIVFPALRLVPAKIKKTLLAETAHAVHPSEAAPAPVIAVRPTGEELPGNGAVRAPATGAAASPSVSAAVQAAVPLATDNRPPEYPALARKRGWQGRVLLAVTVDSDGSVQGVRVQSGSGHELLDEAALRAVREWRFQPGNRGGEPVASQVEVPVQFKLEDNP